MDVVTDHEDLYELPKACFSRVYQGTGSDDYGSELALVVLSIKRGGRDINPKAAIRSMSSKNSVHSYVKSFSPVRFSVLMILSVGVVVRAGVDKAYDASGLQR